MIYERESMLVDAICLKALTTINHEDGTGVTGQAGDWLVVFPNGEQAIFTASQFEHTFKPSDEAQAEVQVILAKQAENEVADPPKLAIPGSS